MRANSFIFGIKTCLLGLDFYNGFGVLWMNLIARTCQGTQMYPQPSRHHEQLHRDATSSTSSPTLRNTAAAITRHTSTSSGPHPNMSVLSGANVHLFLFVEPEPALSVRWQKIQAKQMESK